MSDVAKIDALVKSYSLLKKEIGKVIVGQHDAVDHVLLSVLCGGHSLLIGVPGLAKTLLVNTVAKALGLDFKRIQFTPDLMPSDILGSEILDENRQFKFIKGPIFANIILADEINRTPPKTQAALLEAMQEKSVTVAGHSFELDLPFFVLATQNPIEQEGTYPLPEAQLDRFMMKVVVGYNTKEEELEIARRAANNTFGDIQQVASIKDLNKIREEALQVHMDEEIEAYIVELVAATRDPKAYGLEELEAYIEFGASPRASIDMYKAARAIAYLKGQDYVSPIEIAYIAKEILRHRIILSYEAQAEEVTQDEIIEKILAAVTIP